MLCFARSRPLPLALLLPPLPAAQKVPRIPGDYIYLLKIFDGALVVVRTAAAALAPTSHSAPRNAVFLRVRPA